MVVIRSLLPIVAQQLLRSRDFILIYYNSTLTFAENQAKSKEEQRVRKSKEGQRRKL